MRVKSACNPTGLFPLSPRAARHCIALRRAGEQQNSFGGPPFDELSEAAGPTAREARPPSTAASWSALGLDPAPIARALGGDLGGRVFWPRPGWASCIKLSTGRGPRTPH